LRGSVAVGERQQWGVCDACTERAAGRVVSSSLISVGAFNARRGKTGHVDRDASMIEARTDHTATLLTDGTVLVAGGIGSRDEAMASAELCDPGTGP
jgi:hypothetical protein